jgi:hypothetical protein
VQAGAGGAGAGGAGAGAGRAGAGGSGSAWKAFARSAPKLVFRYRPTTAPLEIYILATALSPPPPNKQQLKAGDVLFIW